MGIKGKVFSQPFLNQESPRTGPGNYCTAQGSVGQKHKNGNLEER